jgi:hypothetical protein
MIVGANGEEIGDLVDNPETEEVVVPPADEAGAEGPDIVGMLMREQQASLSKASKVFSKRQLSRGDLAQIQACLLRSASAQYRLFAMLAHDMASITDSTQQAAYNNFMVGNNMASLMSLLLDKGVFTREELDIRWKETMEKAKAGIAAQQAAATETDDPQISETPTDGSPIIKIR